MGLRRLVAAVLVVLNLTLIALNLDKHGLLPFSSGLWSSEPGETVAARDDSVTTSTTAPRLITDTSSETVVASSADNEVDVDDWPGGRGPVPEGPPVPRRATIFADGRVDLTGSAPDWATAIRIADYAGRNLPGGVEAVNNQLTWHPDASTDVRSGDVVIDQAATFDVGQSVISPESGPALDLAAQLLRSRPSLFVVVIGHTDDVGDEELNAQLALDRANAVVGYLIGTGVVPGQIVVAAAGEDDPTASNETAAGREANRRIELQFKNFLIPPQDFGAG